MRHDTIKMHIMAEPTLSGVPVDYEVAALGRAQGWEVRPNMLANVMGEVRLAFSVTVVRGQGHLPAGEAGPPGARSPGCSTIGGVQHVAGGEEEGEASLRPGQPVERPEPRG